MAHEDVRALWTDFESNSRLPVTRINDVTLSEDVAAPLSVGQSVTVVGLVSEVLLYSMN